MFPHQLVIPLTDNSILVNAVSMIKHVVNIPLYVKCAEIHGHILYDIDSIIVRCASMCIIHLASFTYNFCIGLHLHIRSEKAYTYTLIANGTEIGSYRERYIALTPEYRGESSAIVSYCHLVY